VAQRDLTHGAWHYYRLGVDGTAGTGGGIAVVTDRHISFQVPQNVFVKHLGYQTHIGVKEDRFTVAAGDAGAFLSAVLEGEEGEISEPGYIFTRGIDTENAARLM